MLEGGGTWLSTFITATANFSAQYNFQSIAISLLIMSSSVCTGSDDNCNDGRQDSWVEGTISAVIFVGAVVGQLSMGFLGDYLSRSLALIATLSIAALAALLSGVAPSGSATSIYSTIIFFRFILGIGLGGVFPLSATKASEDASTQSGKVNLMGPSWAFFWQMPGLLCPWLLGYIFSFTSLTTSQQWRLILGLGAVPSGLAILGLLVEHFNPEYKEGNTADPLSEKLDSSFIAIDTLRASMTSIRHSAGTADGNNSESRAAGGVEKKTNKITFAMIYTSLSDVTIRNNLLTCGGAWFLFDIVVYGVNLLGGYIIHAISNDDDNVSSQDAIRNVCAKELTALCLGIPAVLLSIYLLPILGIKQLQMAGFLLMGFVFILLAGLFDYLRAEDQQALFGLYCILCFALQFGLGITSFSMPSILFPFQIRSTFNGLASAMGKAGAAVGAFSLLPLAEATSMSFVLSSCAVIALLGAIVTHVGINQSIIDSNDHNTADNHGIDRGVHLSFGSHSKSTDRTPPSPAADNQDRYQQYMEDEKDSGISLVTRIWSNFRKSLTGKSSLSNSNNNNNSQQSINSLSGAQRNSEEVSNPIQ